jgi:hypothetical protein
MRELILNSGAFAAPTFCQINHPISNPPYIKQRSQEDIVKCTEIQEPTYFSLPPGKPYNTVFAWMVLQYIKVDTASQ